MPTDLLSHKIEFLGVFFKCITGLIQQDIIFVHSCTCNATKLVTWPFSPLHIRYFWHNQSCYCTICSYFICKWPLFLSCCSSGGVLSLSCRWLQWSRLQPCWIGRLYQKGRLFSQHAPPLTTARVMDRALFWVHSNSFKHIVIGCVLRSRWEACCE